MSLEYAEAQKLYCAMSRKERKAVVAELAVRSAHERRYVPEYAEANDNGSARIVWVDGLHHSQDLEFDTSFSRFFYDEKTARQAASVSLRHNIYAQPAKDIWEGVTCRGFAVLADDGVTPQSFAAQVHHVHTITDDDEKDGAMLETLRNICIVELSNDVHLYNLPDWYADEKEIVALIKQMKMDTQ